MDITNIFCQSLDLTSHVARVSGISGKKGKLESLSNSVVERRTSTGSGLFASYGQWIGLNSRANRFYNRKET